MEQEELRSLPEAIMKSYVFMTFGMVVTVKFSVKVDFFTCKSNCIDNNSPWLGDSHVATASDLSSCVLNRADEGIAYK